MMSMGSEKGGEHSSKAATEGSFLIALVSKYVHKEYIVDIGASYHMTSQFELLDRIKVVPKSRRKMVNLPTGDVV